MSNKSLIAVLSLVALCGAAGAQAPAQTWQEKHPRRAEVNARLDRQNARIHREVKSGDMTHQQAAALHHEDHQIRQEERLMASQNGGHITRAEQRALNQQENAVSKQIGK
jgi:coenzyme F420-reducing hydrogenase beta subunit